MHKLIHAILLVSLLLLSLPDLTEADGPCQTLLTKGQYEGTASAVMDIKGFQDDILVQEFTMNDSGQLSLKIDCDVTEGSFHFDVRRTIMLIPGTPPYVCEYSIDMNQPSGNVVVGANGQPRIDVRWGHAWVNGSACISAGPAPGATWRFSQTKPPEGRTISGDFRIVYDDPTAMDYDQLAQQFRDEGFVVSLNKGWSLTRLPQPKVESLSSSLRQYFLSGIPASNRYTASIDWDGGDPGEARFILEGDSPRNMTVNSNQAVYDVALGSIQRTGDIPISIEADIDGRIDRVDGLETLTMVPIPNWAKLFAFQARPPSGDHILYKGEYRLPAQPLSANVSLPTWLPYVGGTWGLLPTQLAVGLSADSSGAKVRDGLGAQGGFGLGKRRFDLAARGNIYGTIRHDDLLFESDPLTLSTSGIFFQERVSLISLIPGAEELLDWVIIGDLLKAVDSVGGITGNVTGSMTGTGRLGVQGDTVKLTEGRFDASLGVHASVSANLLIAFIHMAGGGEGNLSMNIIPSPMVTRCEVLLYFQTSVGAFGYSSTLIDAKHRFVACTSNAGQIEVYALNTNSRSERVRLIYGGKSTHTPERILNNTALTNGLVETILVENTSAQAAPLLVSDSGGRLAFVWNSTGASGAADVVSLRLNNGAGWGDVVILSQSDRPSFNPAAAFTIDGNLLIAWTEAKVAPDPNALTEAFVQSFEVAWAEVDPLTGLVTGRGTVTSDNVMDFAPRLTTGMDGSVWLTWQTSPGNSLVGSMVKPNELKNVRWTGSAWTPQETVTQNLVGTLSWKIAAVDATNSWVVADQDFDGDLSTATDREIVLYKRSNSGWSIPQRLTDDDVMDTSPILTLNPATAEPVLAWSHNGNTILGVVGDPTALEPGIWFDADSNVGPMIGNGEMLVAADGTLTLLYPENTYLGQDIWMSQYHPVQKTWNQPAPIFHTAEQRSALSAQMLADGDILIGSSIAQVAEQEVSFDGGEQATVPVITDTTRLTVTRIPSGFTPNPEQTSLYLPRLSQ